MKAVMLKVMKLLYNNIYLSSINNLVFMIHKSPFLFKEGILGWLKTGSKLIFKLTNLKKSNEPPPAPPWRRRGATFATFKIELRLFGFDYV